MTRFSYMVHDTLDGEMNIHKAYMSRLGITEQEVATTKSTLTNQSYTSYMLDEAYKGGPLEILVAVLSCAWSYQMIGEAPSACTGGHWSILCTANGCAAIAARNTAKPHRKSLIW